MKKRLLILLISSVSLLPKTWAQLSESYLGAFYALPVGQFGATDIEYGGFAKPGWGLLFDSKYRFKKAPEQWSLFSHSTYQWNNMDNAKISEEFTKAIGARTEVGQSRYSPIMLSLGPAYDFSLSEKSKLAINTGFGVMFNNTKAFNIKVYDANGAVVFNEYLNFDNVPTFAYLLGAEYKYLFMPDVLGLAFQISYSATKQKIEGTLSNVGPIDSFQQMQCLNIGASLLFLNKK